MYSIRCEFCSYLTTFAFITCVKTYDKYKFIICLINVSQLWKSYLEFCACEIALLPLDNFLDSLK